MGRLVVPVLVMASRVSGEFHRSFRLGFRNSTRCFRICPGTADDEFGLLESVQKTITAESIGIDNFCTITIFAFYAPLALGMCYARSGCKPGSMSHDLDISNIVWPNFSCGNSRWTLQP